MKTKKTDKTKDKNPGLYDNIYKALNVSKNSLIFDLTKKPKDKGLLHHQAFDKDATHQADLLYLPDDDGFKYVLSVVDVATRIADAEALKNRTADTISKAFKKIWKRKALDKPIFLKVDDGSEFKGNFNNFVKRNGIKLIRGKPGRSRSQALVEYINLVIGKSIMIKQGNDELVDDIENTEWKNDLKPIIEEYNKFITLNDTLNKDKGKPSRKEKIYKELKNIPPPPPDMLEVGQKVRIPLDKPENINNKRLSGKFRVGDRRYEKEPRKIVDVLVGNPIVYTVEGLEHTVYPREALLIVDKPKPKRTIEKYTIEKILKKRKNKGRIEFQVKWVGYPKSEATWELRKNLIKDVPNMIKNFENKLNVIDI